MPRPKITHLKETERIIFRHGERAYVISIPPVWLREYNLSHGDTVLLRKQNGEIVIKLDRDN